MTKLFVKNVEPKPHRTILRFTEEKCSVAMPNCPKRSSVSTCSHDDLNYPIAKKHSLSRLKKVHKCQFCHQILTCFHYLRLHKQKIQNAQSVSETKYVDVIHLLGRLTFRVQRKNACKRFPVNSETENGDLESTVLPWTYWMHTPQVIN